MNRIKFTDKECVDIDNAIGTLRLMSGYMQEDIYRKENGRMIKYGTQTLEEHMKDIKRDITNLKKIFDKSCEFVPAKEGLAVLFDEGEARARRK